MKVLCVVSGVIQAAGFGLVGVNPAADRLSVLEMDKGEHGGQVKFLKLSGNKLPSMDFSAGETIEDVVKRFKDKQVREFNRGVTHTTQGNGNGGKFDI